MISNKKVVEAAKVVAEYCKEQQSCQSGTERERSNR